MNETVGESEIANGIVVLVSVEVVAIRFDSYKNAEGKKYIVLNIPNDKIAAASELLPGMKAPTITKLETDGWSSMASVIEEKHFWEIIGKLKNLGAEGILVMPIEKMIY